MYCYNYNISKVWILSKLDIVLLSSIHIQQHTVYSIHQEDVFNVKDYLGKFLIVWKEERIDKLIFYKKWWFVLYRIFKIGQSRDHLRTYVVSYIFRKHSEK